MKKHNYHYLSLVKLALKLDPNVSSLDKLSAKNYDLKCLKLSKLYLYPLCFKKILGLAKTYNQI